MTSLPNNFYELPGIVQLFVCGCAQCKEILDMQYHIPNDEQDKLIFYIQELNKAGLWENEKNM